MRPRPETLKPDRVVGLVVRHRHDELRKARGKPLRECPNAAVVYDRRTPRQQLAERYVLEGLNPWWQPSRNLVLIRSQQYTSPPEQLTRFHRGLEKALAMPYLSGVAK